jgi:hypothetical protein
METPEHPSPAAESGEQPIVPTRAQALGGALTFLLSLLAIGLGGWLGAGGAAAFVASRLLAARPSPWLRALGNTLLYVAVGMVPALLVVIIFGRAPETAEAPLRVIDEQMGSLHDKLDPGPYWPIVGLVVATILSWSFPRWKLVARFSALRRVLDPVVAVLAVVASFTFFTTREVTAPAEKAVQGNLEPRLRAAEKKTAEHEETTLALQSLTHALPTLSAEERARYRQLFQVVAAFDRAQAHACLEDFLEYRVPLPPAEPARPPSVDAKPLLHSDAVRAAEERAEQAAQAHADAEEGAVTVCEEVLGLPNEAAKEFVKALVVAVVPRCGGAADAIADAVGEHTGRLLEKATERWQKTAETWLHEQVAGDFDAATELTRIEMAREKDLIASIRKWAPPAEAPRPGGEPSAASAEPGARPPGDSANAPGGTARAPTEKPGPTRSLDAVTTLTQQDRAHLKQAQTLEALGKRLATLAAADPAVAGGANAAAIAQTRAAVQAQARQEIAEVWVTITTAAQRIDRGPHMKLELSSPGRGSEDPEHDLREKEPRELREGHAPEIFHPMEVHP